MHIKPLIAKFSFLTALAVAPMIASALPSDANQPIRLLADRATYSERTGVTTYSGNVTIEQGTLKIAADNLTVNLNTRNRSINSAVATGRPATMQQIITQEKGLAKGQANRIDYDAVSGIVTLTGNAKLTQAGSSFSGNVIRYSLKDGDVEANGGQGRRVELIFPPNSDTNQRGIR
ncbi:lipopolysaccharide transport periplasmic protein LptA [Moraxella sp. FZLJ2107]|uniref:lipopolysaccharide transport periplasmic protein LptA n=1 Tax=unclassified Moraxella TaxID=2685852 RepID=UPI0020C87905|nr:MULTISPECIES: lipopolysaccharide transport periplasmic protein LptA [unclassified Moraxella]UTO05517.1 lipopolysaccharide transport periplasmic protein LptA [Moraxella sp. FZLJ2107]UTO22253.1 lipopolysaccharide transport periplasmic protein LptA [Moraxella sp. FZLJ2109]